MIKEKIFAKFYAEICWASWFYTPTRLQSGTGVTGLAGRSDHGCLYDGQAHFRQEIICVSIFFSDKTNVTAYRFRTESAFNILGQILFVAELLRG